MESLVFCDDVWVIEVSRGGGLEVLGLGREKLRGVRGMVVGKSGRVGSGGFEKKGGCVIRIGRVCWFLGV